MYFWRRRALCVQLCALPGLLYWCQCIPHACIFCPGRSLLPNERAGNPAAVSFLLHSDLASLHISLLLHTFLHFLSSVSTFSFPLLLMPSAHSGIIPTLPETVPFAESCISAKWSSLQISTLFCTRSCIHFSVDF